MNCYIRMPSGVFTTINLLLQSKHCKCDWTDTGAKQGFSQLIAFIVHHIVELCRENIGKIPYWLSLFKKQGLSQTQQ